MAADEWGVLDIDELRACGFSDQAVMRRRRRGQLHLLHRGVYAWGHAGVTLKGLWLAAVKACGPGAALSHLAAAALWSLLHWDEEWLPDVTVPTRGTRLVEGVNVHRTTRPFKVVRFDRIPVTTPARTLDDLSSVLSFAPHRRAVRQAMALKRVTVAELRQAKSRQLRTILADGYVPTRSELEDAVLDLITKGGFATPDVNKPIGLGFTPDFRWPAQRLVIEADSREWHDDPIAQQDDAARQAILEAAGERVLRVTWRQAVARQQETLQRIQAAGAPRTSP
jgi:very-short-patch-repair endonuclease